MIGFVARWGRQKIPVPYSTPSFKQASSCQGIFCIRTIGVMLFDKKLIASDILVKLVLGGLQGYDFMIQFLNLN